MGYISRLTTFFGLVLLAHAYVYLPSKYRLQNQLHHSKTIHPPQPITPNSKTQSLINQNNANPAQKTNRGYSAHEHTLLTSNALSFSSSSASSTQALSLPHDIVIEALVSLVLVSVGLVLGAPKLKPISWSEWAGQIEREGGARNPYRRLEERYGFWDIRVGFSFAFFWFYVFSFSFSFLFLFLSVREERASRERDWM